MPSRRPAAKGQRTRNCGRRQKGWYNPQSRAYEPRRPARGPRVGVKAFPEVVYRLARCGCGPDCSGCSPPGCGSLNGKEWMGIAGMCQRMSFWICVRSSSTRGERRRRRRWCGRLSGSSPRKRLAMVRRRKSTGTRLILNLSWFSVCAFASGVRARSLCPG